MAGRIRTGVRRRAVHEHKQDRKEPIRRDIALRVQAHAKPVALIVRSAPNINRPLRATAIIVLRDQQGYDRPETRLPKKPCCAMYFKVSAMRPMAQ